jgi:hypothetical protein
VILVHLETNTNTKKRKVKRSKRRRNTRGPRLPISHLIESVRIFEAWLRDKENENMDDDMDDDEVSD